MMIRNWMVCLGIAILAGCSKQQEPVVSEATPEPTPVAVATPPPAVPVQAAPKQPRLAPEGVFYLVRKVSVTTDSGIMSAHPGTKVTFVREENGNMVVSNGKMELAVMRDHLTNDLDELDAILSSAEEQAVARNKTVAAKKATSAQQNTPPASSAAPSSRPDNSAKIRSLQAQIDAVGQRIQADQGVLEEIDREAERRRTNRELFGKASQNSVGVKESKYVVQQRLAALQRQQNALMMQLNSLNQ